MKNYNLAQDALDPPGLIPMMEKASVQESVANFFFARLAIVLFTDQTHLVI